MSECGKQMNPHMDCACREQEGHDGQHRCEHNYPWGQARPVDDNPKENNR